MAGLGTIFVELDLDRKRFTAAERDVLAKSIGTSVELEKNWRNLGQKSSAYYDAMRASIIKSNELIKKNALTTADDILRAEKAKNEQIRRLNEQQYGAHTSMLQKMKSNWVAASATIIAAWYAVSKAVGIVSGVALAAARYETLGIVMRTVGNNAGYSGAQMEEFAKSLQKSGIAMLESRQVLTVMAQAQIDLTKAQQLGRVAQDAAVIGNLNSSKALEQMIHGIHTANIRVLRTIGINVSFEESYAKVAKALGRTADSFSVAEKTAIRTNAVLEAGTRIVGTYEAAMETAGKQLLSLERYWSNLKVLAGAVFTPALAEMVQIITGSIKDINSELSGKSREAVEDWGTKFRIAIISVEAEIMRLAMLIDKIGGTMSAASMLLYGPGSALGIKSSVERFEKAAKANMEYEARYLATEKALEALAAKQIKLEESLTTAGKARIKAIQDELDTKIAAARKEAETTVELEKEKIDKLKTFAKDFMDYRKEVNDSFNQYEKQQRKTAVDEETAIMQAYYDEQYLSQEDYINGLKRVSDAEIAAQKEKVDAATKAAKKIQEEWEHVWENIHDRTADFFYDMMTDIGQGWRNLFDDVKEWFKRMLSEMAAQALISQIKIPIMTTVFGMSATQAAAATGATAGGTGTSGIFSFGGMSTSLFDLQVGMSTFLSDTLGMVQAGDALINMSTTAFTASAGVFSGLVTGLTTGDWAKGGINATTTTIAGILSGGNPLVMAATSLLTNLIYDMFGGEEDRRMYVGYQTDLWQNKQSGELYRQDITRSKNSLISEEAATQIQGQIDLILEPYLTGYQSILDALPEEMQRQFTDSFDYASATIEIWGETGEQLISSLETALEGVPGEMYSRIGNLFEEVIVGSMDAIEGMSNLSPEIVQSVKDAVIASTNIQELAGAVDNVIALSQVAGQWSDIMSALNDLDTTGLFKAGLIDAARNALGSAGTIDELTTVLQGIGMLEALPKTWNDFFYQMQVMAGELTDQEQQIHRVNVQFDDWRDTLTALGFSESVLNTVEEMRIKSIVRITEAEGAATQASNAFAASLETIQTRMATREGTISAFSGMGGILDEVAYLQSGMSRPAWLEGQLNLMGAKFGAGQWGEGDAERSMSLISEWFSASMSESQTAAQLWQNVTQQTKNLLTSIGSTIHGIKYGSLNVGLLGEKSAMAGADYSAMYMAALGGDQMAISAFLQFAPEYLAVAKADFKSSAQYQAIYARVLSNLETIQDMVEADDYPQKIYNESKSQTAELRTIDAHMLDMISTFTEGINRVIASQTLSPGVYGPDYIGGQASDIERRYGITLSDTYGQSSSDLLRSGTQADFEALATFYNISVDTVLADAQAIAGYYNWISDAPHFGINATWAGFAEGGISSGPESGYLAKLHGTELIVSPKGGYPVTVAGGDRGEELKELREQNALLRQLVAQSARPTKIVTDERGLDSKVFKIMGQAESGRRIVQ